LPLFIFVVTLAVVITGLESRRKPAAQGEMLLVPHAAGAVAKKASRVAYFDYARVLCVACVVIEHGGGESYSNHDFFFVQQWVLPFLYLTSGVGFSMSKRPLPGYMFRAFIIFALGTGANWIADIITGRDWVHDFGNTIFQMGYVIVVLAMSLLLYPVRRVLRHATNNHASEGKPKPSARTLAIFWSLLMSVGLGFIVADRPSA